MPSVFISDFKFGMDRRRERVAGTPGTLWVGKNVVIGRGGDIERIKRFVPAYTLPLGTLGMAAVRGQLYVFGSINDPGVPTGVQYQKLASPDGSLMAQLVDARAVNGKIYAIARFASGNVYHFYDGTRVTDWDTIADGNTDFPTLTAFLADLINVDTSVTALASGSTITLTANVPGVSFNVAAFTLDQGGTNDQTITLNTTQANVAQVNEVRATGTVTITGGTFISGLNRVIDVTVNGVSMMLAPADWTSSNSATANVVASQINNKTNVHGYQAVAVGNVVTITAPPGSGSTPNGYVVAVTLGGNVTATHANMASGVSAVAPIAQVTVATLAGTFEPTDIFRIDINGTLYQTSGRAAGTGTSIFVYAKRVWATANSLWEYCKVNTFTDWSDTNPASGAGFLNVSNESEGSERLVGAAVFMTQAAVFSRQNVQVWTLNADATLNAISQAINNTGALSARSILPYGDVDTFYLADTGVRSLRPQQTTSLAQVNDIGTPIDSFIRVDLDTLSGAATQRAVAVMEPRDARYWLALGPRIYMLSYFPSADISAWTYAEPGFSVTDFARVHNRLYARAGNVIYLYGGASGTVYPNAGEMVPDVQLPFVANSPPTMQQLVGFDMASTNTWQVNVLVQPNDEVQQVNIGKTSNSTYDNANVGAVGRSTHFAVNLTCLEAGPATISNICLHGIGKEPND